MATETDIIRLLGADIDLKYLICSISYKITEQSICTSDNTVLCLPLYIINNTLQNGLLEPQLNTQITMNEWQFSCACQAIMISLQTPSCDRIFCRFGGFRRIRFKNCSMWRRLKYELV